MHNYAAHSIQVLGGYDPKALGLDEFCRTPETQVYGHGDRIGSSEDKFWAQNFLICQPTWTQPALSRAREKELILMGAVVHEFHTIMVCALGSFPKPSLASFIVRQRQRAKASKVAYGPSQTSGSELSSNKDHIDWDNGSTFYWVSGGRVRSPDKDGVKIPEEEWDEGTEFCKIPDVMAMGDPPYYKDEAEAAKGKWDENALREILKGRIGTLNRDKPIVL